MSVKRYSADDYQVLGGTREDAQRAADTDFLIRSGLCPNGCGLLAQSDDGQECHTCHFMCNCLPDRQAPN
jgi:hypothetical protein